MWCVVIWGSGFAYSEGWLRFLSLAQLKVTLATTLKQPRQAFAASLSKVLDYLELRASSYSEILRRFFSVGCHWNRLPHENTLTTGRVGLGFRV